MIDLRQLRYFVAIVDAGSFTRAAAVLHIAQPALSQQVSSLESEVGSKLLNRSVRGVTPTDGGWAVYRHAQTILKLTAQTRDVAQGAVGEVSGRVRLGLPSSIAMILAAPLLTLLGERYPGVLVEIYESASSYLSAQLFDERVDLSVLVDKVPSAALATQPLVDEQLYFVQVGGARPAQMPVTVAALAQTPMILTTRATTLRHTVDAAFAAAGIEPQVLAEASSIQTLLTVVAQGRLATLIPYSALSWQAASGTLERQPLDPPVLRRATLAWSRNATLTDSTRCVRSLIVEIVRRLVGSGEWQGATLLE